MEAIRENVNYETAEFIDKTQAWSLLDTGYGLFYVLALYFLFALVLLPEHMIHRPPYRLKKTLLFYNAVQVALSLYLVVTYINYILKHGVITTRCPQGKDLEEVISDTWPYFIAKHLDLLDTCFFVLRKKTNQVSGLHLYHHTSMVAWTWLHHLYHPTDHFVVVGMLNSFVHVLMYAYYGVAALGPEYAKYLWWKKYLTKVQLVQFILVIAHLHYQQKLSPCPLPTFFHYFCCSCIGSFFILFLKFYFDSYMKNSKVEKESEKIE